MGRGRYPQLKEPGTQNGEHGSPLMRDSGFDFGLGDMANEAMGLFEISDSFSSVVMLSISAIDQVLTAHPSLSVYLHGVWVGTRCRKPHP